MKNACFTSVCLIVLVLCCSAHGGPADSLVLVQDGRPKATIVLAEKPTAPAQLAAYELQYHLKKMSGAVLPIANEPQAVTGTVILVGESNATKKLGLKNTDFVQTEYMIEATPTSLMLIGRDWDGRRNVDYDGDLGIFCKDFWAPQRQPIGTCYAVHTFLENVLGVRWYMPTEVGEVIPQRKTVTIAPMKIRRKTDVAHLRGYPFAVNKRLYYNDYSAADWKYDECWDLRGGVLYWIRNKHWGRPVFNANHSFISWDTAFGKKHPEWFSTKSWEKMKTLNYQFRVNPCLSQEGVFRTNLKIIRDYFDGKKAAHGGFYWSAGGNFFGICLNDNGLFCPCAECTRQYRVDMGARGSLSNYVWNYTNRLAREVRKTHRRAKIIGLAYSAYTDPPKGIQLEPNTGVLICRMPNRYWHKGYKERDYKQIRRFIEDCKAPAIFTWEYLLHPFADLNPFPPVLPRIYAEDAKFLTNLPQYRGGFMQIDRARLKKDGKPKGDVWPHPVLDHFRIYFRLKLYDDKTRDVEGMLSEYYTKFYGPAAAGVRDFVEALEGRWCDQKVRKASGAIPHLYGDSNARVWWEFLGTPDFVEKLQGLMAKAKKPAPAGSVYARRVDLLDKGIMQLILNNRRKYAGSDMAKLPAIPEIDVPIGPAPTIDGRCDEALWREVPWQGITRTNMNKGLTFGARFRAVADHSTLYLLIECTEPFTENILAEMAEGGPAVLFDDSLEVFIDRDPGDGKYYQLGYNTIGGVFGAFIDRTGTEKEAATWKSDSKAKVTLEPNKKWIVEIAIPWKNISGGPVTAGQTWRLNVCRNRRAGVKKVEYSNWSVCGGGFHNPARFGKITFRRPEAR